MTLQLRLRFALFFIAACAYPAWAAAQNDQQKADNAGASSSVCLTAKQLTAPHVYGQWRVRFATAPAGLPADAVLRLEKHAEFSESVAGLVSRDVAGQLRKAQLAGDIEDGFLTLDESSNGISITGTWNGEMVIGSCGKKFTGTWKDTSDHAPADTPDIPFTLEKLPGW
jgi:hypothetical protein